ncbi:scarecrow-like protein 8 [Iris pallida]|uniref:Scarecrow-like protein 8 n=1 Tax=Iris pallida TaxID=29817 RepID=A0AAX6H373_IRIPA|nr:scarecrow-like protein 8 [Iris pallida]KAJ6839863.1 scarecrow-like protein 8 [Iris pallida]
MSEWNDVMDQLISPPSVSMSTHKLGLMVANLAIIDVTRDQPKIHVFDFEIVQGGQYAALIHAVAERCYKEVWHREYCFAWCKGWRNCGGA